jgi:hypothetical protein
MIEMIIGDLESRYDCQERARALSEFSSSVLCGCHDRWGAGIRRAGIHRAGSIEVYALLSKWTTTHS